MDEKGQLISTLNDWNEKREHLKKMLADIQYGNMPPFPKKFEVSNKQNIEHSNYIEETFDLVLKIESNMVSIRMGIIRPNQPGNYPVVIKNCAFRFHESDFDNPDTREKYRNSGRFEILQNVIQEAVQRGYILCKFIRTDIAPDHANNRNEGVFPLYPGYNWGTIAAWAWGHSLAINYLETQEYVDTDKIIVTGHSRGGKTALCAGIYDERIAITVPNSSGTGGTGSWIHFSPDHDPQLMKHHIERFPHWWNPKLYDYNGIENEMPFDSHINKALIAPRALLNTHARHDYWANPYGTWLTHNSARKVFKAFQKRRSLRTALAGWWSQSKRRRLVGIIRLCRIHLLQ